MTLECHCRSAKILTEIEIMCPGFKLTYKEKLYCPFRNQCLRYRAIPKHAGQRWYDKAKFDELRDGPPGQHEIWCDDFVPRSDQDD